MKGAIESAIAPFLQQGRDGFKCPLKKPRRLPGKKPQAGKRKRTGGQALKPPVPKNLRPGKQEQKKTARKLAEPKSLRQQPADPEARRHPKNRHAEKRPAGQVGCGNFLVCCRPFYSEPAWG